MMPKTGRRYISSCSPRFFLASSRELTVSQPCSLAPSALVILHRRPHSCLSRSTADLLRACLLTSLQNAFKLAMSTMVPYRGGGGGGGASLTLLVDSLGMCRTPGCDRLAAVHSGHCNNRTRDPFIDSPPAVKVVISHQLTSTTWCSDCCAVPRCENEKRDAGDGRGYCVSRKQTLPGAYGMARFSHYIDPHG